MSVFDVGTRIPLLISAPWLSDTHGTTTDGERACPDTPPCDITHCIGMTYLTGRVLETLTGFADAVS
jgi:hypothetical protein